jgi:hypothetical protein
MDLNPFVDSIHRQLADAAETGGEDARALAERLAAPLDAAIRLALQDALSAAADEITRELAPGSVELRIRGRNPEFVVSLPPAEFAADAPAEPSYGFTDTDEGGTSRINLRLPDQLKVRVEQAALSEGLSANTWLVRAASAALDRGQPGSRREGRVSPGAGRFTGWVR